jgi:hypothetical protein
MKRLIPLALAALSLGACNTTEYTTKDYWAILPDVVRRADADARQAAKAKPPEGPVWIDVNSFAGGGWQLTGDHLNRDSVMAHVANPAAQRVDKPQDALVIQDTGTVAAQPEALPGLNSGRYVKGYGVLLHLNLVKADNREIAVTVTNYATDRSVWPTGICRRVLRVTYRKNPQGAWGQTKTEVRRRCEDPD